ncbi:MAG: ethanolamine utilization protein EutQ [Clostridiales bacterium]|jgi:ethanolamine utilization protein EutQ|nr:ethanolamine utilization protein EutQ [Clostridiales bacterium]
MNISEELIRAIVEQVIRETQKNDCDFQKQVDPSGIIGIKTSSVKLEPFADRDDVLLKDVTTLAEAPRIGCGIMELKNGASFEWTLTYDEFDIIQEGCLEIEIDGRVVSGGPGDIIYIPKNSHIHFRTPDHTKYVYIVYPADWQ